MELEFSNPFLLVPVLSQMDPVRAIQFYFLNVQLAIAFQSIPRSSKSSLSLSSSRKTLY
jgi:hypothetical protein